VRKRPSPVAPGQHFLRSSRLAADLVRDAEIGRGELVVDIGAGSGVLTAALLDAGARVLALEADPALVGALKRRFVGADVTVVHADARRFRWSREPFRVFANLPFAGSGEILGNLLGDPRSGLVRADLIVQWELAQKQTAVWPATMRATYWRAWFELGISGKLSRHAFSPPPRVDAGVLRISRRVNPLVPAERHVAYRALLAEAFGARVPLARALRRQLAPREVRRLAAVLGFDPAASPRDLDARQWSQLYSHLRSRAATRDRA
jgi:23S rRNA (adenine-N6)-dimethyltransferase